MAFVIKPVGLHYVKIFTRFAECKQASSDMTQRGRNMRIPFFFVQIKGHKTLKIKWKNVREEENDFGLSNTASAKSECQTWMLNLCRAGFVWQSDIMETSLCIT